MGERRWISYLSRRGFFKLCFVAMMSSLLVAVGCGGEGDEEEDD